MARSSKDRARSPRHTTGTRADARAQERANALSLGQHGLESLEARKLLAADLNLSAISTLNTVRMPGQTFDADFTVMNTGDTLVSAFRVEYRLSRNTTWGDADDILLGFRHVTAPLAAGGQTTLDEEFDVPRNVFTGNYFLGALADSLGQVTEGDENNNLRFTSIAQIILANSSGQVDIDVDVVGVTAAAGTYNAGQNFATNATYRNTGTSASGAYTTIWFLSTNQVFGDSDDIQLSVATTAGLPGNQQIDQGITFQIPISAASGAYYFGIFVDARFDINEPLEEGNNIAFTATPSVTIVGVPTEPDLQAVETSTAVGSYEAGDDITISATLRNGGNATTGEFEITYTLSLDTTIGDGDDIALVFKQTVASLGPGESRVDSRIVTIPDGAEPGFYYLTISIDPDNEVEETSETNNTALTSAPRVTILPPPPDEPDIQVLGGGQFDKPITHLAKAIKSNRTLFGQLLEEGETRTTTFKIRNNGIRELRITNIVLSGREPGDYEILLEPDTVIEPGGSSNFQIRFDPTAFLVRRAKVVIFSNDPDQPRFDMKVRGRGMPPVSAADIDVKGLGKSIVDNDRTPQKNTGTKYGRINLGETSERVYTIRNIGQSVLTLSGAITLTGASSNQFQITVQPTDSVLAPGESTTFTILFSPTLVGGQSADVLIPCDDPDEPVFNFRISGSGFGA